MFVRNDTVLISEGVWLTVQSVRRGTNNMPYGAVTCWRRCTACQFPVSWDANNAIAAVDEGIDQMITIQVPPALLPPASLHSN